MITAFITKASDGRENPIWKEFANYEAFFEWVADTGEVIIDPEKLNWFFFQETFPNEPTIDVVIYDDYIE